MRRDSRWALTFWARVRQMEVFQVKASELCSPET